MAAWFLLPEVGQAFVYDLIGLLAGITVLVGIRLHRPERPTAWLLLAAAPFAWVAGDVSRDALSFVLGANPFVPFADVLYLAGYPLAAAGLILLVRPRGSPFDWHGAIDPAVAAITIASAAWVVIVHSAASDTWVTSVEWALALAYPIGDVILLSALIPALAAPGRRTPSIVLLAASLVAMTLGDAFFALFGVKDAAGGVESAFWLVGCVLWGTAALHPSMAVQADTAVPSPRLTALRLAGFLVALSVTGVVAAAALAFGYPAGTVPAAVAFVAVAVLACVRLTGLARDLAHEEDLYRTLVERSADAIFLVAGEPPRILEANAAAADLLRRGRDECRGLAISAIVPQDELSRQRERIAAMRRSGAPVRLELPMVRRDGGEVLVEMSEQATRDGRIVVVARDIGERKRAEADRARLAAAVHHTADSVVVTDVNADIVYVNPAFEAVTGYDRAEVLGRNPRIIQSGFHGAEFYRAMWDTLAADATWSGELVNRRKDGTRFTEEASISPVRDESGAITAYVAVKRDVTRQRALERSLWQAQKMEALGRFAGGIAHDFNNLLTAIHGYAELIRSDLAPEQERIREDVAQVLLAAGRGAQLVRQILAFSRVQPVDRRLVDPFAVCEAIVPLLRPMLSEQVEVVLVGEAGAAWVLADPSQLEQVILNAVVNANHAMPAGGVVTIETRPVGLDGAFVLGRPEVAPGPYVMIAVSDTGTGMDTTTQARAFEPFFTTREPGKGTGMGLATVYGIVKQSGGYVYIESAPGRGTTIRVYLPRAAGEPGPAEPAIPPTASTPEPARALDGAGTTILLVEDEPAVRAYARRALENRGYCVLEAANGAEGLRVAAEATARIDALITDVVMPGMGGGELAARLTAERPDMRVLYTSGFTERRPGGSGLPGDGRCHFLPKPFTTDVLCDAVRDTLSGTG